MLPDPIDLFWKSGLLAMVAAAASFFLRGRSAALRHAVWMAALGGALLLPLLFFLLPGWEAGSLPYFDAVSAAVRRPSASSPVAGGLDFGTLVWLAGSMVLLSRLAPAYCRLGCLIRESRCIDTVERVSILEGNTGGMAFTAGLLRPAILLPVEADAWPARQREAVIWHELAHARRRDCLWNLVARVACAVFWFQPLMWLAATRAMAEAEHAADDRVLLRGTRSSDYAGFLLQVARSLRQAPATAAAAHSCPLESRLRAILTPTIDRRSPGKIALVLTALVAAGLLLPLAAMGSDAKLPRGVYRIGKDVTPPKLISKIEPGYSERARDEKVHGTVKLSVIISNKGVPRDIKVLQPLHPDLDANAVKAVSQWRFEPGRRKGKPVNIMATVEVNFKLI